MPEINLVAVGRTAQFCTFVSPRNEPTMSKKGPIFLIEDDEDDQLIISQVIHSLGISNPIQVFCNGQEALDHLEKTQEQPFLINLGNPPPLAVVMCLLATPFW